MLDSIFRCTRRQFLSYATGPVLAMVPIYPAQDRGGSLRIPPGRLRTPSDEAGQPHLIDGDLDRYAKAIRSIDRGSEPTAAFAEYLEAGSAGLMAYARLYDISAASLVARLDAYPMYYAELARIGSRVRGCYDEIRRSVANLLDLAPHTPLVPVFLFVGAMGPGATPREVTAGGGEESLGLLIPVERVGITAHTDMREFPEGSSVGRLVELPWLVCHELAHVSQIRLQGLEAYRRIYREPSWGTHLAYAVREGGADLLAVRAAGHLRSRHRFVKQHEAQLWTEFSELLYRPIQESSGWFGGQPGKGVPGRPHDLGYGIGWAICQHYYDQAEDQATALRTILSAKEPADFERIVTPYLSLLSRPHAAEIGLRHLP